MRAGLARSTCPRQTHSCKRIEDFAKASDPREAPNNLTCILHRSRVFSYLESYYCFVIVYMEGVSSKRKLVVVWDEATLHPFLESRPFEAIQLSDTKSQLTESLLNKKLKIDPQIIAFGSSHKMFDPKCPSDSRLSQLR